MDADRLRRLYNGIALGLDYQALRKEKRIERDAGDIGSFKTASAAFSLVLPLTRKMDRRARLKMIAAPDGTDVEGRSNRWEFFFDLPKRQAKLVGVWALRWDDERDGFGRAHLELIARPFPPAGTVIRNMIAEGKLVYPQLKGHWRQEQRRSPDLPHAFRDSDEALTDLITQGLNPRDEEFSLGTKAGPSGDPDWVAQTRAQSFYARFLAQ